jgi:hypothetical protein
MQSTSQISTATLLMHPLMARAAEEEARWSANAPAVRLERFRAGFNRGRVQRDRRSGAEGWARIVGAVEGWFDRHAESVGPYAFRRGLVDLKRRRIWSVDIVCELDGACCLVCLFHGGRERFAKHEVEYARRMHRVALGTYGAAVRVVCLKVWGREGGRVTAGELGEDREGDLVTAGELGEDREGDLVTAGELGEDRGDLAPPPPGNGADAGV